MTKWKRKLVGRVRAMWWKLKFDSRAEPSPERKPGLAGEKLSIRVSSSQLAERKGKGEEKG